MQTAAHSVEVPESMRVHCPLVDFKLRKVTQCLECPHLVGGTLADRFPGANHMPVVQRYAVPCSARPTLRQMTEVE
ncbi:MAG TPA: hypothetical protein DDX06_04825 [Curvibacter sp.]|nr:hypothetical protein [Curvibacter sp.]